MGQRAFGESYAQELAAKAESLRDLEDIEWHFIGHLQANKVKAGRAVRLYVAHTVDSAVLAHEARQACRGRRGARRCPVLVEVNVSGEAQKHGTPASEIDEVLAAVRAEAWASCSVAS